MKYYLERSNWPNYNICHVVYLYFLCILWILLKMYFIAYPFLSLLQLFCSEPFPSIFFSAHHWTSNITRSWLTKDMLNMSIFFTIVNCTVCRSVLCKILLLINYFKFFEFWDGKIGAIIFIATIFQFWQGRIGASFYLIHSFHSRHHFFLILANPVFLIHSHLSWWALWVCSSSIPFGGNRWLLLKIEFWLTFNFFTF